MQKTTQKTSGKTIEKSGEKTVRKEIPLGRYRHYKGRDYSVLGFARHSETGEIMVLYVPLYGEGGYWVRPLTMFTEEVEVNGERMPRFRFLGTGGGDSGTA